MSPADAPALIERFRLERPLGSGGMAVVYAAYDRQAGERPVALKVQRVPDATTSVRFEREAEILAALDAPGIVGYRAHGHLDDGRVWLALEWLTGETLLARLQRGALPPDAALALGARVARSLSVLHAQGVVHRDIKPENLFLRDGRPEDVCLLDLGIARLLAPDRRTTRHGMVVGTPAYMAPEQARAAPELDHRADLYALGTVLYECFTGQQAWPGQNALAVMVKILVQPPPRLARARPDLPPELDALVGGLMAMDPMRRPPDAAAAALAIEGARVALPAGARTDVRASAEMFPGGLSTPVPLGQNEVRIRTFLLVGGAPDASTGVTLDASSPAWSRVSTLLRENDATLVPLADGSLLVTFDGTGFPTDRAARAARCALAVAAHLPDAPLVLATGSLRADVGRGGSALLGAVIDRAADAVRATPPGQVRVDATTAGLLDARFVLDEPVAAERGERLLLGEVEPLTRARLVRGRPSPFVGRERELLLFDAWLRDALRLGRPHWIRIHGPPGIGKTRLRDELLARWLTAHPQMPVLSGACPEKAGPGTALRDALLHGLGSDGEGSKANRRSRISGALEGAGGPETIERALPFLAEFLGVASEMDAYPLRGARRSPEEMDDGVLRALVTFFGVATRRGPVVVALDDVQWLDAASGSLLRRLTARLARAPLVVLLFQRDPPETADADVGAETQRASLALRPLADAAAERLVAATLGVTADVRSALVARAEGSPFALEELVRAAADGPVHALPDTVLAMVQARLGARPPAEARLLRAASVFRGPFSDAGLLSVLEDASPEAVGAGLLALRDAELVDALDGGRWQFAQATVREAAAAMLTPEDLRVAHARAAAHLGTCTSVPSWEIAEHLVSADRGAEAAPHFVDAADGSLARNDLEGAARTAQRGLEACGAVGGSAAPIGALHQILAHVAGWQGRRAELAMHVEAALSRLETGSARWCRAVGDWATLSTSGATPWPAERLEALIAAAQVATDTATRSAAVVALCRVATRASERGADEQSEALFQAAFAVGQRADLEPPTLAIVQRTIAARAWRRGDTPTVEAALRRALYELELHGFERLALSVRGNLGATVTELGRYDEALELLDVTVRGAARLGLVRIEAVAWHNLGHTLFRVGRLDDAFDAELTALEHFDVQGDALMAGAARCYLARIHTHQGRPAQGEQEARRAARGLSALSVPLFVLAQAALIEALLAQGRLDEACAAGAAGEAAARTVSALGEGEVLFDVLYGEALDATGATAEARLRFRRAAGRVVERAARFADPEARAAFCAGVAENAQALARETE
ncbi:protein kinase [Myxococcota bacterium]|nr:protein kinase [Myxococcota bacterium]